MNSETSEGSVRVLGIAGSLRRESYNRRLLAAARELAPEFLKAYLRQLLDWTLRLRSTAERAS